VWSGHSCPLPLKLLCSFRTHPLSPRTRLNRSERKVVVFVFVLALSALVCAGFGCGVDWPRVRIGLRARRTFAGGFVEGGDGKFRSGVEFDGDDNLLWLRLFQFDTLEIRRRNLERVEQEGGGFPFDSFLQDHLHDLADDGLNGMRILKNGQNDFAGWVLCLGITLDLQGTMLLMVETEDLAAESGRTALGSADLDMPTTSCF